MKIPDLIGAIVDIIDDDLGYDETYDTVEDVLREATGVTNGKLPTHHAAQILHDVVDEMRNRPPATRRQGRNGSAVMLETALAVLANSTRKHDGCVLLDAEAASVVCGAMLTARTDLQQHP